MTDPGFKRSHSSAKNDKLESHADMFQPFMYHRLPSDNSTFVMSTLGELKQYTWARPVNNQTAGIYRAVAREDVCIWCRMDTQPMTIADVHWLYPFD